MKRLMQWVMAATLICGAMVFTACNSSDDNPVVPIDNLAEKLIGKWMISDIDGKPAPTNFKEVITFVSPTKAYMSKSVPRPENMDSIMPPKPEDMPDEMPENPGNPGWEAYVECDVTIEGNTVILTAEGPDGMKRPAKYVIKAISESKFTCENIREAPENELMPPPAEDKAKNRKQTQRYERISADHSDAILGLWECTELTGIETYNDANARLEFFDDGTYKFWRKTDAGEWEAVTTREFQKFFVDGTLLATLWKNTGEDELREWWEIASIADGQMTWTALRGNADGTTVQQTMKWKKVATE